jgi:hypothetical protein
MSSKIIDAVKEKGIIIDKHPDFFDQYEKAILATDVTVHVVRRNIMRDLVDKNLFDITTKNHRELLKSLLMTCSDLFTGCSDWQLQNDVAQTVYEEFWNQGEKETELKIYPSKNTTRTDSRGMAEVQVEFVQGIVLPAFQLLADLVPEPAILNLLEGVMDGMEHWQLESGVPSATTNSPAQ